MSREVYESLLNATNPSPEARWLSLLALAGARWRGWREESLAWAEFAEGLWLDEAEGRSLSDAGEVHLLAADDRPALSFPARYAAGPWQVVIGVDASGQPYCALTTGSGPARITAEGLDISLSPGGEAGAPDLYEPPASLTLEDAGGRRWTLDPVTG